MLFQEIIFWALSAGAVGAALGVVLLKDVFRSALLLIVLFLSIAGHFVLLAAEFLAVVQVLIYGGAISILIIFAIMLTQNIQQGNLANRIQIPAVLLPALLLAALIFVFIDTDWRVISMLPNGTQVVDFAFQDTPSTLASLIFKNYALGFGASGALLLASIVGALSLVRGDQ
ncbi:NADH-quinone oxidoreductase subunit L [SAR202 cluster bacterium AD-804-J14_MRT_500m]|nr:NADH-quinone oxidoreductase subunit L [SAR202 cluster bacterium AD-804-J14_MRT_500m]